MAISRKVHELYTYRFYPRAYYYHKRAFDLYQRFRHLLGVFPSNCHISGHIDEIDNEIKSMEKPPKILLYGNCDLDLSEIVVSMAPMDDTVQPYSGSGIDIVIIYVEIERADPVGLQKVEEAIQSYRHDNQQTPIKERIFLMCKFNKEIPEILHGFQTSLSIILQQQLQLEGPWEDQLILSNGVFLKNKISNYLEKTLLDIFDEIRNYLNRFLTSVEGHIDGEIIEQPSVNFCLKAFVNNKGNINDIIKRHESVMDVADLPAEERYLVLICEELARRVNCTIASPLSIKYKLPLWLCSDMLTGMSSTAKFKESLSASTKSFMKKLVSSHDNESENLDLDLPARKKKHDFIVDKIKRDLTKPVFEIEKLMKSTKEMTDIVEKMIFEIGGYFKQSTVWSPAKKVSPVNNYMNIKTELLGNDQVFGVGTIYGQLEIHLTDDSEEARKGIENVIKKHSYSRPYRIKSVDKRPVELADLQHEHGKIIYTKINNQERKGTLGAFVENEQKVLYALTCAHVVRAGTSNEDLEVFVEEKRQYRQLGVSTAAMALFPGEVRLNPMIDIAAVRIDGDIKNHCVRFLKDDDAILRTSVLADPAEANDLASLYVYKYGATTDLTKGMVCSNDYMLKAKADCGITDSALLIESLPANTKCFAREGDSGSIVCLPTPGSDIVTVLSMVSGGEFKLANDQFAKCISLMLKSSLQEIFKKSQEQLFLCF